MGKNKAAVMARRYGKAFNVPVAHIENYITSPNVFAQMLYDSIKMQRNHNILFQEDVLEHVSLERQFRWGGDYTLVVIDATDNNKTRLILETVVEVWRGQAVLISSGNEEKAGQVVFTAHNSDKEGISEVNWERLKGLFPESPLRNTPTFFDLFPRAPLEKLPTELSCAEATVSAPQAMIANITAANIIFNFCNKLLAYEPIRHFLIFFDAETMGQKSYRLTKSDLSAALTMTPNNAALVHHLNGYEMNLLFGEEMVSKPTWEDAVRIAKEEQIQKELEMQAILQGVQPS